MYMCISISIYIYMYMYYIHIPSQSHYYTMLRHIPMSDGFQSVAMARVERLALRCWSLSMVYLGTHAGLV